MNTKEKQNVESSNENIRKIPLLNIRMMSDEEWNRLAYRNYLERQDKFHVRA